MGQGNSLVFRLFHYEQTFAAQKASVAAQKSLAQVLQHIKPYKADADGLPSALNWLGQIALQVCVTFAPAAHILPLLKGRLDVETFFSLEVKTTGMDPVQDLKRFVGAFLQKHYTQPAQKWQEEWTSMFQGSMLVHVYWAKIQKFASRCQLTFPWPICKARFLSGLITDLKQELKTLADPQRLDVKGNLLPFLGG